jgi:hypothetical protein
VNPALDALFSLLNAPVDACPKPIPPGVPPKASAKKGSQVAGRRSQGTSQQTPASPTTGKPVATGAKP